LVDFIDQQKKREDAKKGAPTLYTVIDRFISDYYKKDGEIDKAKRTLQNYNAVKLHLETFSKKKNYRIDFDTITRPFFKEYTNFLRTSLKLQRNTIAKDITILKVFMNRAVSEGYTTNLDFKHREFTYKTEETDSVYLKEAEIEQLFNYDAGSNKLNNVKDLFVAGCWLGLRYSDLKNIKPFNIIEDDGEKYIKIYTQKTGEEVIIPCHPMVIEVMKKYRGNPNSLPKAISRQKFSEFIKEVCKDAELKEKGRMATQPNLELWECISSHTMRRSMASNFYLQGVSPEEIMTVTGHKTRKSFDSYIKVSKLDKAKKLNAKIKKLWQKAYSGDLKLVV
jgi:integrase